MVLTQKNTYKPSKKTMEQLRSGEKASSHKEINYMITNLSPLVDDSDPFTSNVVEKLWKAVLPFKKDQVSRMEEETKQEIIEVAIKGLIKVFNEKIDFFLGEHFLIEKTSHEKKLKHLVEYGEEAELISDEELLLLNKYFEELLRTSSKFLFKKHDSINIGPDVERWEVISIRQTDSDNLIGSFHSNCLKLFSDFSYYCLDAVTSDWFIYLDRGLSPEEKETYKTFKLKPLTYVILLNFVREDFESRIYRGELLSLDKLISVLHHFDCVLEIETIENINKIKELCKMIKKGFVISMISNQSKRKEWELLLTLINEKL